ncbi:MAG: hypothetical protein IPK26_04025 [Planctomycetes bacterium]|nr:hypothetical protein [Planctomycetota bacterium]
MAWHLPLVLLTPTLLCLLAALAAAAWARRGVPWFLLLPAWALSALNHGLWTARAEFAGPVLQWCRVDDPGIALSIVVLPLSALVVWRWRADPEVAALRAVPRRLPLLQAALAATCFLPLPTLLWLLTGAGPWRWRIAGARWWFAGGFVVATLTWRWPGAVDAVGAVVLGAAVLAVRPFSRTQRCVRWLLAFGAVLAAWRAVAPWW